MTTTQQAPTIGQMLREKRAGQPKAPIYRQLGIKPGTYDTWEADAYIPGDEYAEVLGDYLGFSEREMAWTLYRARRLKSAKGVSRSSFGLVPLAA
jgi:hypothetical protein